MLKIIVSLIILLQNEGVTEMKELYTVSFSKVFEETIGNDAEHKWQGFKFKNVSVDGKKMDVFFCKNEKGMFVIAGTYVKGAAYRSCGHWHSGKGFYKVYFRKNFRTREEGNDFYKKVKTTMEI